MIIKCLDLPVEEQVEMMNLVRKWKSTEEARKSTPFSTPSHEIYGRGLTPKTYQALYDDKKSKSDKNLEIHDYLIKTSSGEIAGVIGYNRHYMGDDFVVVSYGLYVILLNPSYGSVILKALSKIYEEMLDTSDEVCVIATMRTDENSDLFKKCVLDKYEVLSVEKVRHMDCDYEERDATKVILKGRFR